MSPLFKNVRCVSCVLLFGLFILQCAGKSASADTLHVPSQYPTIVDAVNNANPGDTILVADGTYTGVKNREIDFGGKDLIVKSENGPTNCIIDCQQAGRAFHLTHSETTASHIEGFTITNGRAGGVGDGGGMYIYNSNPTVSNCVFIGNTASDNGGGIFGGTAINCTFTNNSASGGGGMYGGTATNCTFTGNTASSGGGMNYGTATNCTFTGNRASYGGGMVNALATNCTFRNNSADTNGGGMFSNDATNCTFTGNTASGNGGGADNSRVISCLFFGNSANGNGGGLSDSFSLNCTIVNNTAKGNYGGGIYISAADTFITNCIVWNNTASLSGPNIENDSDTSSVVYSDVQGGYPGTGNINADPHFVNPASGDFHLKFDSPCIEAGTIADYLPDTDLDGKSRLVGNEPDMGAYEYSSPGITGILNFAGLMADSSAQNVTFQLRPVGGGAAITKTLLVPPDGAYRLYNVPTGKYNLWIKPNTFLAVVIPVDATGSNTFNNNASLFGGDANNDNVVDIGDFGVLVGAFGATGYDPATGYDARADFNGDGNVDIGDFGLLVNNYGSVGAP